MTQTPYSPDLALSLFPRRISYHWRYSKVTPDSEVLRVLSNDSSVWKSIKSLSGIGYIHTLFQQTIIEHLLHSRLLVRWSYQDLSTDNRNSWKLLGKTNINNNNNIMSSVTIKMWGGDKVRIKWLNSSQVVSPISAKISISWWCCQ